MTIDTGTTKAKQTARAVRVWIEGGKLTRAGFAPGTNYIIAHGENRIDLAVDPEGRRAVTMSGRGDKARPIIDLHDKKVAAIFSDGDTVNVTYSQNAISLIKA